MKEKIKLYAIVGPTASGKSALALEIAERCGGEIVSCDSMQVYRKMNIGTAKPTQAELERVPHHLIDVADPTCAFSCADYVELARRAIDEINSRGKTPIVCGGTGLYLDALIRDSDFAENVTDELLRAELIAFANTYGVGALHARLAEIDPESAAQIHPNNVKRVARAIEIYSLSGKTKTELDAESQRNGYKYDVRAMGLFYSDRESLYSRIDTRVDQMLDSGLADETRMLVEMGVFEKNTTAAQAIGYKELLPYIKGDMELDAATDELKMSTRRYAKRQITWFSHRPYVVQTDVCAADGKKTFEEIVNIAEMLFFN